LQAGEIALSCMLLLGATLLVRSFIKLLNDDQAQHSKRRAGSARGHQTTMELART
jgi:hypothetical protein